MADDAPVELKIEALRMWRGILVAEEARVDSGEAAKAMAEKLSITTSKKICGDQDSDASLVGSVLSQRSEQLYDFTRNKNATVRYVSVDLIGQLLRQGLVNPMETVPHLFAILGDTQAPETREIALQLLARESEKRPDVLRQRFRAGIIHAFEFQKHVFQNTSALIQSKQGKIDTVFDRVFADSIRPSRVQRHGLYKSLLSLFDKESSNRLELLGFAAQVLSHLPYSVASDPLFIIHHISQMTTLRGPQVMERFASLLRPHGIIIDELDPSISDDALEKVALTKAPSKTKLVSKLFKNGNCDLGTFSRICLDACAVLVLFQIKFHLKKMYNLSEIRCIEYTPEVKDRGSEKCFINQDGRVLFDAKIAKFCRRNGVGIDIDAVLRLYADFKKEMRNNEGLGKEHGEEPSIAHVQPENQKRKRQAHL
eukprot:CAMPEP_0118675330 /NCGR_PEP_ID=MMETSP0800-20121206/1391_1 /TAXON_ID=210618 ORGANISM="Striatella unipunctata, Strain CCMP2910" /NCGR_SAMPLE_ID=MMETSP0800 /ASSEMBLY_ACC=CAM_ASM_000638 /LENGTH=424 /DNA_ID=CAMNT_0006570639 /DNA_START=374 /DNA_END=1648 /DNA_ORIENTATION=-